MPAQRHGAPPGDSEADETARYGYPADVLVIAFSLLLILLAAGFASRVPMWPAVVATSGGIIALLAAVATAHRRSGWRGFRVLHQWAFLPIVYVIYLETYWVIGPVHGGWVADHALIAIDGALFRGDPLALLARIATPWLTEIAQVAYTLFYPLVIVVGAEIYVRRSEGEFLRFVFACACGFLTSYLGYLLLPAVGPRFTLYDFASIDRDLPGVWVTPALRAFVNIGGLVPTAASKAATLGLAHRDAFPSGHTLMTVVSMWWCWRSRLRLRWGITAVGTVLIFATVYLRYHYVIDILAGALLALGIIVATPRAYEWIERALRTCDVEAPTPGRGARSTAGSAR